jgi:BASS family bile acid:Na+ symporter
MSTVILPLALAFLMFTVGLRLSWGSLAATAVHPAPLLSGLAVQMLLLPALAWLIVRLFQLPPDIALGLMVIAACPGGITSNYVTLLAGADVALSTAMTLVTSLAASLSIPLLLGFSGIDIGLTSLLRMALVMTAVAAIPLLLGMLLRAFAGPSAARLEIRLDRPAKVVFAAIVLATFWQNRDALIGSAVAVGPAVILLNVGAVLAALSIRLAVSISRPQVMAIAVETGLQNAAIAIFICTTVLSRPELAVPALIYAVVMNITALVLVAANRAHRSGQAHSATP